MDFFLEYRTSFHLGGRYQKGISLSIIRHRIYEYMYLGEEMPVIVVESYISVWWLTQIGSLSAVALMGSSLSENQERLIVHHLGPRARYY
jgi:hypothetical protein